jgi:hypothetical protein
MNKVPFQTPRQRAAQAGRYTDQVRAAGSGLIDEISNEF